MSSETMSGAETLAALKACMAENINRGARAGGYEKGSPSHKKAKAVLAAVAALLAERDALAKRVAELEGFSPTDAMFDAWCKTHYMLSVDREAFEDAATLYIARAEASHG